MPGSEARVDRAAHDAHECATQLLRLEARAREVYAARPPAVFAGFGELLDEVLPHDAVAEARVARGVGGSLGEVRRLRMGAIDPLTCSPRTIAALGHALALSFEQLADLATRDRARLQAPARAELLRTTDATDTGAIRRLQALGAAWDAQAAFESLDSDGME